VVPIVLGRGERLWDGLEALEDTFQIEAVNSPSGVTHVTLSRISHPGQHPQYARPVRRHVTSQLSQVADSRVNQ
jgi:hypothetical protein